MRRAEAAARFLVVLLVLPALRCATVYSRGIVEDGAGAPVGGANVRLLGSAGATVDTAITDANGCFFLQRSAPKGERRFTLEVGASGFKAARLEVPLDPPIVLVALAPDSSPGPSVIRPTTTEERSDKWERQCIPLFAGGGAQQLSPR